MQILSKKCKFREIKMLKTNPLLLDTMQCSIKKLERTIPGRWSWEKWKNDKNFRKIADFIQKMQISRNYKIEN